MGKIKSAILLTLFTLVIAALCFLCTTGSFYLADGVHIFDSILTQTAKDADLGGSYGAEGYSGGGYSAVYYPEGVISAKEYEDNLGGYADEEKKEEYRDSYVPYLGGILYLDKDEVCGGGTKPTVEFKEAFDKTVALLEERYALLRKDGAELSVVDDYTVRVFLPKDIMDSALVAFTYNSYTGAYTVRYGSDVSTAETILPARSNKTMADYFTKAYMRTSTDGTAYIVLEFTEAGRKVIASKTETANTMYFMVGENTVIPLTVSEAIDEATLYISGSYTAETAEICANVINTVFHTADAENTLVLSVGDVLSYEALYGGNALNSIYIAWGVSAVLMMVFFFVRYRRLGFVHLYTYLMFTLAMVLCVWSIPFLYLSLEAVLAFLFVSLLLSVSNVMTFEYAKREYESGKTMTSSVKAGYKKSFWHIFDLHIVIAVISFIVFGVGITNLSTFAFILGLGTVFSAFACLAVNRLMWAIMMSFTRNKGGFCNFKRKEVEDD